MHVSGDPVFYSLKKFLSVQMKCSKQTDQLLMKNDSVYPQLILKC